jgi:amidase
LTADVHGLRLGIVEEGFGLPDLSESDVDDAVRQAAHHFERLGARVRNISIPWHRDALHVWNAIAVEGIPLIMASGNGMGSNWKGHYMTSLFESYARGRLTRGNDLSPVFKLNVLLGEYVRRNYHGHYYAKAQNLMRDVARGYDAALEECDILVMPTTPMKATPLPPPDCGLDEFIIRSEEALPNTAPFCASGHPSMNVPCGVSGGLPIGMMLTGRVGDDKTVLTASHAFETEVYAAPPVPAVEMRDTGKLRNRAGEWGRSVESKSTLPDAESSDQELS